MVSEALVTGRNIINDVADSNAKIRNILRRNVTESAHRLINKLSGQGRKRECTTSTKRAKKQPSRGNNKKTNNIKGDMFS